MAGLRGDLIPREDHADELLHVRLHTFDAAVEHALREWERHEPLARGRDFTATVRCGEARALARIT